MNQTGGLQAERPHGQSLMLKFIEWLSSQEKVTIEFVPYICIVLYSFIALVSVTISDIKVEIQKNRGQLAYCWQPQIVAGDEEKYVSFKDGSLCCLLANSL